MFLFDLEDFKCDQLPNDWSDYETSIREVFDANLKCLNRLIISKKDELSVQTYDKLLLLFQDYVTAVNNTKANLNLLIVELSASPSGSDCFDKTSYNNYLASYSIVKDLLGQINLLLITDDNVIGYDLNVGVDTTVIPFSGSNNNIITKCTGAYMKQINCSPEFLGSVTILNP
jgi:hypothetical protein